MALISSGEELQLQGRDDGLADLVLQGEDVGEIAVPVFGPDVAAGLAVDERGGDAHPKPALRTLPSSTWLTSSSRATLGRSTFWPLNRKLLLREMTKRAETLERSVMISSLMPSEKYSCSGSPLILAKGETQMESLRVAAGGGLNRRSAAGQVASTGHDLPPAGRVGVAASSR